MVIASILPEKSHPATSCPVTSDSYRVQLDVFQGPLDLLLYLVRRDELDIYDIPLDVLATQYLVSIEEMKTLDIDIAAEFISMAAHLVYLKSRTLLPKADLAAVIEEEEDDPRYDFIRQLVEYKKFKEAARDFDHYVLENAKIFPAIPPRLQPSLLQEQPPLAPVGPKDLRRAFEKILARLMEESSVGEIVDERFTVRDKMEHLLTTIAPGVKTPLTSLFESSVDRIEVIVTFLALLELMKNKLFAAFQDTQLGEILLLRLEDAPEPVLDEADIDSYDNSTTDPS